MVKYYQSIESMHIIDGRVISKEIFSKLKNDFASLSFQPVVYDVLVGCDPVSISYVNIKARAAGQLGLNFKILNLEDGKEQAELIAGIAKINKEAGVCGIVLQLPLPKTFDQVAALNAISPELDVDAMGKTNLEKFYNNEPGFVPPTVAAIWEILRTLPIDFTEKNFCIIGQGELVGRPLTHLLKSKGFKVTTANSGTLNIKELALGADVIVSATGKSGLITKDMVSPGAIVVDAGTSESNGAIVGDVDFVGVAEVAGFLTPVPGGVGPVTVAMLYYNVLQIAKKINKN